MSSRPHHPNAWKAHGPCRLASLPLQPPLSLACTSHRCFSHTEWFSFPSGFLLPECLTNRSPKRLLEYSTHVSPPFHTSLLIPITQHHVAFLELALCPSQLPLRMKSFGQAGEIWSVRHVAMLCPLSDRGHAIVNLTASREGCWSPADQVAICHPARQDVFWLPSMQATLPKLAGTQDKRECTVLYKWLSQDS